MSELSKLDTLLHKTPIKVLIVLRYQGSTCVDLLSKIAHEMWHDHHLAAKGKRTTEITGVVNGRGLEVKGKWGGGGRGCGGKNLKKVGNIRGVFIK